MSTTTIHRHGRGTKVAGAAVGGQFAPTFRSEADGFLLADEPAPQHWDGTAQTARDILDEAKLDDVIVDGVGAETVIYVGTFEADAADVLEPNNGLTREEQAAAIRARAENLLDRSRLAQLSAIQGSFTPELDALKQQEITELVARIDEFDEQSRWADDNMLAINSSHTVTEEQVGRAGRYTEKVSHTRSDQHASSNSFTHEQTLTAGLPPFTQDTLQNYQLEIADFLVDRYGAEVTINLESGLFTAERATESVGAATGDRVSELVGSSAQAMNMQAAGTRDEFADEELFEYLGTFSKVGSADIIEARDDWAEVADVSGRVDALGDRMKPGDWAVALQAVAPKLGSSASTKSVRAFINQGKADDHLASQLQRLATNEETPDDFRKVARLLSERLLDRPLIDRPAPAWG